MSRGKIIDIEGTDGSGKATQSKLLVEELNKLGIKAKRMSYPVYDSPTGKIVGGPLIGKEEICSSYFDNPSKVDYLVASLYYAADRRYHLENLLEELDKGNNIVLDRYVYSNMAHQGGKIKDENERMDLYDKLYRLEFDILDLPKPDKVLFLYLPFSKSQILREKRGNMDNLEKDMEYLINSENAYIELADIFKFDRINCYNDSGIRSINSINNEIKNKVLKRIK